MSDALTKTEELVEEEPSTESSTEEEPSEELTEKEVEAKSPTSVPITRFNEVYGRMKELERTLTEVVKEVSSSKARPEPKEESLPDFDSMSNAEIAHWTLGQTQRLVKEAINETVGPVMSETRRTSVERDIRETASKYPDFWDYRDKMVALAEKHPTLSAEDAYHLASGNIDSAKRSVLKRVKQSIDKKKAARTETKSSTGDKLLEAKEFKTIREAGLAQAKKLGLI